VQPLQAPPVSVPAQHSPNIAHVYSLTIQHTYTSHRCHYQSKMVKIIAKYLAATLLTTISPHISASFWLMRR